MDILYTTYPMEIILEDKSQEHELNFQYISYQGINMQVEPVGWNKFKVIRLYSTDPAHYLDYNLQPGSIIST